MKKRYESRALAAIHETMQGLHDIGVITAKTMKEFDETCLAPVEDLAPAEIAEIRLKAGVSQSIFARYLEVSVGSVSKWERGEKHPSGPALKLLNMAKRNGLEFLAA